MTLLLLGIVTSCNSQIGEAQQEAGVHEDNADSFVKNTTQLRVVYGPAGAGTNAGALNFIVSDSITFRAAVFDLNSNYIEDVESIWSMSTNAFPAGDLVVSVDKKSATFTPTAIGTLFVSALYAGNTRVLLSDSDSTGQISVTSTQFPGSMLVNSGNNQLAVVNNSIGDPLEVKVLDTFNQPIEGAQVLWTVGAGGGSILSTNPSFTNAQGIAQVFVKVGTSLGVNNNIFRGTLVSDGSIFADFSASGTPAAEDHIVYQTSPLDMYVNTAFGIQPVIELQDSFNNRVETKNTGSVTITIQTGGGALIGTATANFVSGRAAFSDIGYDTAENPVILRATYNAMTADTGNLDISVLPPGFCTTNDASFRTSDGGCKELGTGLVWSLAANGINYYQALWDTGLTGASAADADDFGRTNDYDEGYASLPCGAVNACDDDNNTLGGLHVPSTLSYCHDLNEGGKTDWRVPTVGNLINVTGAYMGGTPPYFQNFSDNWYYIGSGIGTNSTKLIMRRMNVATTYVSTAKDSGIYNLVCVRGNRQNPDRLGVVASGDISVGVVPVQQIEVQIQDPALSRVHAEGHTVTMSTDFGTLGGTVAVQTDKSGTAIFNAFTLDTPGVANLTFSAPGFSNTTVAISVKDGEHICQLEDASFTTLDGGCKDLTSGLVWSRPAAGLMTWNSAIWDSTFGGSSAPEPSDGVRTNDYDADTALGGPDADATAYCHDRNEGGRTDWRMPSLSELSNARVNGYGTHFTTDLVATWHWTSTSINAANGYLHHMGTGSATNVAKTNVYSVICVRGP